MYLKTRSDAEGKFHVEAIISVRVYDAGGIEKACEVITRQAEEACSAFKSEAIREKLHHIGALNASEKL